MRLRAAGMGEITTEIAPAGPFSCAEDDDQQYLHRGDPGLGSCGQVATGVACRVGVGVRAPPAA
jgi:peptide-methionine (S)-S-oxide reductase